MNNSEIQIFTTKDGKTEIEVQLNNETVWLSQKQMAHLFGKDSDTIGLHLKNIYKSGELEEIATTENSSVVQKEGNLRWRGFVIRALVDKTINVFLMIQPRCNSSGIKNYRM